MKYVPVLRYRQQERKAFRGVSLSSKTLPLIELVTEKLQSNARTTSIQNLIDDITDKSISDIIVDIPAYIPMGNQTKRPVSSYLTPLIANPMLRIGEYAKLPKDIVIPTISYTPQARVFSTGIMSSLHTALRAEGFTRFAYRVFIPHFSAAMSEIGTIVSQNDIVILDVDDSDHTDPALSTSYSSVQALKTRTGCTSVIIRSAINNITNSGLVSGAPVFGAVNTILSAFPSYGFDAFGDFAGTKKDDLKDGGTISPGLIYYKWSGNVYYGFNSPVRNVREFEATIVPSLQASPAWTSYSSHHHNDCYGCRTVDRVASGSQSGSNQGMWKGVSIAHYLYTMEEFL